MSIPCASEFVSVLLVTVKTPDTLRAPRSSNDIELSSEPLPAPTMFPLVKLKLVTCVPLIPLSPVS